MRFGNRRPFYGGEDVNRYIISFILIALQVVLIVAILGFFGVETTSFAALLAATGIAIGAAWGGCWPILPPGLF
ncbi:MULTISPECIES: hypothetical protein [unclassified Microcystis]|uniref:hypothetical protein n=1 Tax=unclassified Microcystis TaxID=2643300 RepID=UPI002580CD8E|nr:MULTISPECIES: hypothetical protein [unclassified Microcystis]